MNFRKFIPGRKHNQNPFPNQRHVQSSRKKKGCVIKVQETAIGMKLEKSPECKPEDVEAFMRAYNQKKEDSKNLVDK